MACYSDYTPRFQKQLVEGDPYATLNCTCYAAAMLADYASCGSTTPSGERVRQLTGDTSGGTRLSQIDTALAKIGIQITPYYGLDWDEFVDKVQSGRYAILQGWYDVIRNTRYSGSQTFRDNHAIGVPPGFEAQDPLADGRRAGIYQYHKEVYPKALLKEYAGKLNVAAAPATTYRPLGHGYVYAAFSVAHPRRPLTPPPPPAPHPPLPPSVFGVDKMITQLGLKVTSSHTVNIKKGIPLYREPRTGADIVTRMSATADVNYMGRVVPGYRAVQVRTSNFPDKLKRPVIVYVDIDQASSPKAK